MQIIDDGSFDFRRHNINHSDKHIKQYFLHSALLLHG